MNYDDAFVGVLAMVLAILAVTVAVGPWDQPYRLRTVSAVQQRYGKPVARGLWIAIAIAVFTSGFAILSGIRPSYAEQSPAENPQGGRSH